jgi:diguanylate cyclase (GGDEF)-like protein
VLVPDGDSGPAAEARGHLPSGFEVVVAPADGDLLETASRLQPDVVLIEGHAFEALAETGGRDSLTGLHDHKEFAARLAQEAARAKRNRAPLSLLCVHIDGMATVLDYRGREAGDGLLALLARRFEAALRLSDTAFRMGEDDFAVILPDTDVSTANVVAERLQELIRAARWNGDSFAVELEQTSPHFEVTASMGVAELRPGRTEHDLLERARASLANARESGGNAIWRSDDRRRRAINTSSLARELTEREWSVLSQLALRRTEQEIAKRLGIRSGTVRSHKARIRRKLQISPNVRLADFAQEHFPELAE